MTDAVGQGSASRGAMPVGLRLLSPLLGRVRDGLIRVRWIDGREYGFGDGNGPVAIVSIRDARALRRLVTAGVMGLAEGYIAGDWDSPDLSALLDLAAHNSPPRTLPLTVTVPRAFTDRVSHLLRANTRRGSRRNIAAHYDLGNDFYALMLDPSMTYSCAFFDGSDDDLATAQVRKWDHLLDLLQPRAGESMLEIGCGWGGFAVHAARTRGCRVVGITISEEQLAWAASRVRAEGLEHLVEIRLQDYRDVTGTFDCVASIEMFEAVGERFWPGFFRVVRERLKPGGVAALQTITIADERFADYRRRADFAQRYIFPGGMLPSPSEFARVASEAGLTPGEPVFHGADYALTLEQWRERFEASVADVRALGFDERFERTWRYYLAYCRAGFRNGMCDVMQVALR
jgi:cyclopropane-fatty-acyl-phospholipid synthase